MIDTKDWVNIIEDAMSVYSRVLYKKSYWMLSNGDFGPYGVGSFTLPAVWIESFLLLSQSFGLHGVQAPLLILHLLPLVTQDDTYGSECKMTDKGLRTCPFQNIHSMS